MYKIVFIDIDGTLKNEKRETTKRTKDAILKCTQKGILIVICSGRPKHSVEEISKDANASKYIIASNGAQVYDYDEDKTIFLNPMKKEACKKIYDIAIANDCKFIMNLEDHRVITRKDFAANPADILLDSPIEEFIDKNKIMQCLIQDPSFEKIRSLKKEVEIIEEVEIKNQSKCLTNPNIPPRETTYYDIADIKTSKGLGVEKLCKFLNIDLKEAVAIGDDFNDIPMFEKVGLSVVMGNANDTVKKYAKIATEDNDNDGVAIFLEDLLNGKY